MNATYEYEFLAYAFHRMTGYMAPGKSDVSGSHTYEERQAAWEKWLSKNGTIIRAFIHSASCFGDI